MNRPKIYFTPRRLKQLRILGAKLLSRQFKLPFGQDTISVSRDSKLMNAIIFKDSKKDLSGETGMYAVAIAQEVVKAEIDFKENVAEKLQNNCRKVTAKTKKSRKEKRNE